MEQLRLPDGRQLDVRVSGPDTGVPLVFHHGTPGAGTPFRAIERGAHARGLRLVTTSRPGYGHSDRQHGRRVVDVVPDVRAVLDMLDADRCLVAGWSGGGPHALACAARLDAAAAVLVIAGVAPYHADGLDFMAGMGPENVEEFGIALKGEAALAPVLTELRPHLQAATIEHMIESLGGLLPDVDRAVLTDEFADDMVSSFGEAMVVSADGWVDDDLAFVEPWGFALDEIDKPVVLWQGSEDKMVPFSHGQWLAAHVPNASVHLVDGEGHLSIAIGAIDTMLDELVSAGGLQ